MQLFGCYYRRRAGPTFKGNALRCATRIPTCARQPRIVLVRADRHDNTASIWSNILLLVRFDDSAMVRMYMSNALPYNGRCRYYEDRRRRPVRLRTPREEETSWTRSV